MGDSITVADAVLSARRPGVTASSLRSRFEGSVRSAYDVGSGAVHSMRSGLSSVKNSIPDHVMESAQRFTLACLFIVTVEFAERFTYYSFKNMRGTYAKQMLNWTDSTYNLFGNYFDMMSYGTPLIGAYVADAYLGRFKTISSAAPFYVIGVALLALSASPLGYGEFPFYPSSKGGWANGGFWAAATIIGCGCGLLKPNASIFAAEQLKDKDGKDANPRTLEKLYLWWYLSTNIGAFIGSFVGPYISGGTPDGLDNLLGYTKSQCAGNATIIDVCKDYCPGGCLITPPTDIQMAQCCTGDVAGVNYWLIWGCMTGPMVVFCFSLYFLGYFRPGYLISSAGGSYMTDFFKCLYGMCKYNNGKESDGKPMRCLEKLKGMPGMPSDRTIDEFRMVLTTSRIYLPFCLFWFCDNQLETWGMNQCSPTMKISGWMDCNQVQNLNQLAIIAFIPIFDYLIYPGLHKLGFYPTHVQKIAFGISFMGVTTLLMGGVQSYINAHGHYTGVDSNSYVYNDPANYQKYMPSVYWQAVIFALSGIGEIIGNITCLELAYVGSPPSMKGMVMAFALTTSFGAALLGYAVNPFYTPSNSIYYMYIFGAVTMVLGPITWLMFRNMKTGRDLMPELFEENLNDVIRSGAYPAGAPASPKGMVQSGTQLGSAHNLEPGSKYAMDVMRSAKGMDA